MSNVYVEYFMRLRICMKQFLTITKARNIVLFSFDNFVENIYFWNMYKKFS